MFKLFDKSVSFYINSTSSSGTTSVVFSAGGDTEKLFKEIKAKADSVGKAVTGSEFMPTTEGILLKSKGTGTTDNLLIKGTLVDGTTKADFLTNVGTGII